MTFGSEELVAALDERFQGHDVEWGPSAGPVPSRPHTGGTVFDLFVGSGTTDPAHRVPDVPGTSAAHFLAAGEPALCHQTSREAL